MNLRPPGYEPGELPDCSTPQYLVHLWCKKIYYDVRAFNSSRILIVCAFPHFREFRHADDQVGRRPVGRRRIRVGVAGCVCCCKHGVTRGQDLPNAAARQFIHPSSV